ncbi:hypothetical protein BG011_003699 [Mortierella polycephala]|uniref:Cyclin-dependent kinases regulatory subunit n=1 Tax=Mortierella polycephala TaxID=41804 RepID=A0A9P6Q1Q9_9FUNG|nr:hypothetical protein BG011_003699 [Mortierella polycephala]
MTSQTSHTSNLIYHDQDENYPPPQHQQQYRHSTLRHQSNDRSVAQETYYADENLNDDDNLYDKEVQPALETHPDPRPRQRLQLQRGHTRAQYHPQPSQSQQQQQYQQQQQQRHQGQARNRREQVLDDADQENNGPLVQKEIEDARGIAYDNQYQSSRMELMERRGTKISAHQQLSQTNQGQTVYQEHHVERDVTYQQQQQNQIQAQRPPAALARQQSMSQRPQQPPQPQVTIHRDDPVVHSRKRSGRTMEEGVADGRPAAEDARHQAQAQQRVPVHATQQVEQQRRQQHPHKHQHQHTDEERRKRAKMEQDHARKMEYVEMYRKLTDRINYGDVYNDTTWEYRNVTLPKQMLQLIRNIYPSYMQFPENPYSLTLKLLKDQEWRNIGIRMSNYWENWMRHDPEPHVLLFRRPFGTGERLARERDEQEKEEKRLQTLEQVQAEAEKLKGGTGRNVEAPQEGVKQQSDQQQQLHLSPPPKQKYQDEQSQRPLPLPQKQRQQQQPLPPPPKQLQLQQLQQQQ